MRINALTLMVLAFFFFISCRCSESKTSDNDILMTHSVEKTVETVDCIHGDTLFLLPVLDSLQIRAIKSSLRNNVLIEKDFSGFDIEEADYYFLGRFLVVRCMLAGPSGWSSNFHHYFVIDSSNHNVFYFRSLSNNTNNMFLYKYLFVNSVEYPDRFFSDTDYFDHYFERKEVIFKVIYRKLSTSSFEQIYLNEKDTVLSWDNVYELLLP